MQDLKSIADTQDEPRLHNQAILGYRPSVQAVTIGKSTREAVEAIYILFPCQKASTSWERTLFRT